MTPLEPVPIWVNGQDLKKRSEARSNVSKTKRASADHRNARIESWGVILELGRRLQKEKRAFSRERKRKTKQGKDSLNGES